MTYTTFPLDAHELYLYGLGVLVQMLGYLGKSKTLKVEIGNLTFAFRQIYHRFRFADHPFIFADTPQWTANFFKVKNVMLNILRQQIMLSKITADKSINHFEWISSI